MSLLNFGFKSDNRSSSNEKKGKGREESKKNYEKEKRVRNFLPKWKKEFEWVTYDEETNLMYCEPCKKFHNDGRFVTGSNNFRYDSLKQHNESSTHMSSKRLYDMKKLNADNVSVMTSYTGAVEATSSQASGSNFQQPAVVGPLDLALRRINEDKRNQLIACFNTAYFVAKRELPFTLYPELLELQTQNGVDFPLSYQTDQACRRFMEFIFKDIQETPYNLLRNANVISVMFDGATDVAISENEIVYARIVDKGIPKNFFVSIVAIEHAHANGVLAGIESAMDSVAEGWNWKEKLIATGSDGASVNIGKRHSVTKLLKDQVPHLVAMHCVSHRLELGALDAMKDRDAKTFDDLRSVLLSLHKHYHYSAKALRELELLAAAMEEKMLKPVNLEGTRWMPHLSSCLKVLLEKYSVFVAHFENTVEGKIGTVDVQARAKNILKHLRSYTLLHYMHFLQDVLSVLSELSLELQKDRCDLPNAKEAIETACLKLVALQQRPGQNLQRFLNTITEENGEKKFRNAKLSEPTMTAERLKEKQNDLIEVVIDRINRRLGDLESNDLLKDMQVFYPVNIPETDAELAVYGEESVNALCDYYTPVLNRMGCDIQVLKDREWPALKVHMRQTRAHRMSAQEFYNRIYINENLQQTFKNVTALVEIILSIPVSSAVCERGFSAMARIKSDWRSKLHIDMLNFLMAISIQGPNPSEYNAERALAMWWHGGQRTRRPDFDDA